MRQLIPHRSEIMSRVETIADAIIAREGGYVDDPDDPGGATNFGVTIHTMRRLGLDVTGDGQVTADDVKRLTRLEARRIFIDEYYHRPRISWLPIAVQPSVFDMQVNAGNHAVRLLQKLLLKMDFNIAVDGHIGPATKMAAASAAKSASILFVDAYGIERRNYYYALADRRAASRKYARTKHGGKGGWIKRAETFISPRFHLSDTGHRERIKAWG